MTKEELFKKYAINDDICKRWDSSDDWFSVELYRIMHNNNLPKKGDASLLYVLLFLDNSIKYVLEPNFGSLYLTAKRMVFKFYENILNELNNKN